MQLQAGSGLYPVTLISIQYNMKALPPSIQNTLVSKYSETCSLASLHCQVLAIDESYTWKAFGKLNNDQYACKMHQLVAQFLNSNPDAKVLVGIKQCTPLLSCKACCLA